MVTHDSVVALIADKTILLAAMRPQMLVINHTRWKSKTLTQ